MIFKYYNIPSPIDVVGLPVTQCASLLLEHGGIAAQSKSPAKSAENSADRSKS